MAAQAESLKLSEPQRSATLVLIRRKRSSTSSSTQTLMSLLTDWTQVERSSTGAQVNSRTQTFPKDPTSSHHLRFYCSSDNVHGIAKGD